MKLFVDDLRDPPDGSWTVARSIPEARDLLMKNRVTEISLDHDMGACTSCRTKFFEALNDCHHVSDGHDLAVWMTVTDHVPAVVSIHTQNPVGRARIERALGAFR